MAVITISRQYGSGGDEIADLLCQELGYHQFDKRLISQAAVGAGLSDQEIIDFSEENYKVKNFMDRLFNRSQTVAQVRVWKEDAQGVRAPESIQIDEEYALMLTKRAVEAAHHTGNIVIVGRGGQVILKDYLDVVHIRIEAPLEDRIQRVKTHMKAENNISTDTVAGRRKAQDLIGARDLASSDYLHRFYGVDWADPCLYHLVINTGKVKIKLAVQMIIDMVNSPIVEKALT
jgi:cytidylate kinase